MRNGPSSEPADCGLSIGRSIRWNSVSLRFPTESRRDEETAERRVCGFGRGRSLRADREREFRAKWARSVRPRGLEDVVTVVAVVAEVVDEEVDDEEAEDPEVAAAEWRRCRRLWADILCDAEWSRQSLLASRKLRAKWMEREKLTKSKALRGAVPLCSDR